MRRFLELIGVLIVSKCLRVHLLFSLVMAALASSGGWNFVANSLAAHDFARTVAWSERIGSPGSSIVVAIDDQAYASVFGSRSPLDRDKVAALVNTVAHATSPETPIVIDLDLSPAGADPAAQRRLDAVLAGIGKRLVLANAELGEPEGANVISGWQDKLCASGVRFGLPLVPTEYGYPSLTRQFQGSLAQVAIGRATGCGSVMRLGQGELPRLPVPLSPTNLAMPAMIPFTGDLAQLALLLRNLPPQTVVIGGAWGKSDLFDTPFGQRYGMQIHAAEIDGAMSGARLAPYWVELTVAWLFVAIVAIAATYFGRALRRVCVETHGELVGHQFFLTHVIPILMMGLVLGLLWLLLEGLSIMHAATGVSVSTAKVGLTTVVSLLVTWNMGRSDPIALHSWREALQAKVTDPIGNDLRGIVKGCQALFSRHVQELVKISRPRAAFETVCCASSLVMQTVVPLVSICIVVMRAT